MRRLQLLFFTALALAVSFAVLPPSPALAGNYILPAFITNAYFTPGLAKKGNSVQPTAVFNSVQANTQVAFFLVLDLLGDKGTHNVEIEMYDNSGKQVTALKLKPWTAPADNSLFQVSGKFQGKYPPGSVFFRVFDTHGKGEKSLLGTYRLPILATVPKLAPTPKKKK